MKLWAVNSRYKHAGGFTLVELLIVIVVIAILAAITIVAYNGVQDRAKNTATIQAAVQAQQLINVYTTTTGQNLGVTTSYCLTQDNKCASDSGSTAIATDNSSLISTLQPYGNLPSSVPLAAGVRTSYAANRKANGILDPLFIVYWLKGSNTDCGAPVLSGSGTNWNSSSSGYSASSGGMTECVLPLTDASTL